MPMEGDRTDFMFVAPYSPPFTKFLDPPLSDSVQVATNESPMNSLCSLTFTKEGQGHSYSTDTDWQ